eukprot:COSAG05_NODE_518_length_9058_cov_13.477732_2_plen_83_part_00
MAEKAQAAAVDARLEAETTARETAEKEAVAAKEAQQFAIVQAERDERAGARRCTLLRDVRSRRLRPTSVALSDCLNSHLHKP